MNPAAATPPTIEAIKGAIRDVLNFPKPGIVFKDITPVLRDPNLFRAAVDLFSKRLAAAPPDAIVAIDARGFIFGAAVAYQLGVGLIPVRKRGKLPGDTVEQTYNLEYGTATVAIHTDALVKGQRIVIVDDLLATGGTAQAAAHLVEKIGGRIVELQFLIELSLLQGREKLKPWKIFAPIVF